ncbi:hypothetical protein J6590_083649 [Homalodisca vitripennis]|nr:hypothetical protein J6590_083649 [Homalodisca vitripennis]
MRGLTVGGELPSTRRLPAPQGPRAKLHTPLPDAAVFHDAMIDFGFERVPLTRGLSCEPLFDVEGCKVKVTDSPARRPPQPGGIWIPTERHIEVVQS